MVIHHSLLEQLLESIVTIIGRERLDIVSAQLVDGDVHHQLGGGFHRLCRCCPARNYREDGGCDIFVDFLHFLQLFQIHLVKHAAPKTIMPSA